MLICGGWEVAEARYATEWFGIGQVTATAVRGQDKETAEVYVYTTARSVISNPLSMIAKASRSSASVMHSGGLVKKVFQRTKV